MMYFRSASPRLSRLMVLLFSFSLLAGCVTTPGTDGGETDETQVAPEPWEPRAEARRRYIELVESAQENFEQVDVAEMRAAFIQTRFYQPYAGAEQQFAEAMFEALDNERMDRALSLAGRILQDNYVSLDAHYVAREVYEERDDARRRRRHDHLLRDLFDAIQATGDGSGPETAFEVISTREMHSFLALYGLELIDTEFSVEVDRAYDQARVQNPATDEEFVLWFDVTPQWRRGFDGF